MKEEEARKIADETRKTYDTVARKFSDSRAKFWDELAFLAEHIERDDHVLDIGCGNGRFFTLVAKRHAAYTGIDYSEGLIDEAKRLHPDGTFESGDATALPFLDDTFDIAYSFAVIHHIPSNKLRAQFVREAARVLHPGSLFILTAWELWNFRNVAQLFVNAVKSVLGLTTLDIGDLMFTFGKEKAPRYLHAFTEHALVTLINSNGFTVIDSASIARPSGEKNIVVVARKN
jgi:ubiquinone/menaquinone biosynthesis C-methylase UbiE